MRFWAAVIRWRINFFRSSHLKCKLKNTGFLSHPNFFTSLFEFIRGCYLLRNVQFLKVCLRMKQLLCVIKKNNNFLCKVYHKIWRHIKYWFSNLCRRQFLIESIKSGITWFHQITQMWLTTIDRGQGRKSVCKGSFCTQRVHLKHFVYAAYGISSSRKRLAFGTFCGTK